MSLITKIFGTHSEREVKRIMPIVEKIEALGEKYSKMTDAELRGQTDILKGRLAKGATLADAHKKANEEVSKIECENLFHRTDIGHKAFR